MSYIGRDGKPITDEQWRSLHDTSPAYKFVRRFQNADNTVFAFVTWYGFSVEKCFLFTSTEGSQDVSTEAAAINLYEDYLAQNGHGTWFPSSMDPGKHNFLEHGNTLKQEGRDNHADAIASNELYGSW